jgi:membrane associated rhomboid family serine protease
LANCKQCGADLPTFTFGEASPYCKACRAQQLPAHKPGIADALASLETGGSQWLTATNALIAVNVTVFLAMIASGVSLLSPNTQQLLRWGADYGPDTLGGQYWRIITSGFLHIGILHIALNMWCLWSLGRLLERLVGPFTTASVYLVTGAGAALLSLSWNPMRVSAGASGAIFGIAGVLIPVLYYGKLNVPPENISKLLGYVVRFSLLNLLYGLRGGIDNMAHLGGLVTGLLAGLFLARSFSLAKEDREAQRRMVMGVAALAVALLVIPVAKAGSYAAELREGQMLFERQDYNSAIEHLKKYTAARPEDAYGYAILGSALQQAKRYDEAAREYERGLALMPRYAFIQVNLAEVYLQMNKPDKAVELFRAGIPGVPPDADIYYYYAQALKATDDLAGAEGAARQAIHLDDKDAEAQGLLSEILKAEAKTDAAQPGKKDAKNLKRNAPGPASTASQ